MFDPNSVRKVVNVRAVPQIAWRVFTEKMGSWWPLAIYKIGKAEAVDAVVEPYAGGRWYERGEDGSACDWGRVLAWEPPSRLVLMWDISADWQFDPGLNTEVEVRFIADGKNGTRVEFEHRRPTAVVHAVMKCAAFLRPKATGGASLSCSPAPRNHRRNSMSNSKPERAGLPIQ